ncbi:hypothetical protein J6590_067641 [Homalodisca vitripennis]|nr:hypothetical protein J6590_067641 [Homalodisca vitripennis]
MLLGHSRTPHSARDKSTEEARAWRGSAIETIVQLCSVVVKWAVSETNCVEHQRKRKKDDVGALLPPSPPPATVLSLNSYYSLIIRCNCAVYVLYSSRSSHKNIDYATNVTATSNVSDYILFPEGQYAGKLQIVSSRRDLQLIR